MAQGYSFESFVGYLFNHHKIKVSRATLFNWKNKDHASFQQGWLEAYEIATGCNLLFWEKQGIEGLYSETEFSDDGKPLKTKSAVSTGVWALNMRNRHGWKDKIEVSGPDNKPLVLSYKLDDEKSGAGE